MHSWQNREMGDLGLPACQDCEDHRDIVTRKCVPVFFHPAFASCSSVNPCSLTSPGYGPISLAAPRKYGQLTSMTNASQPAVSWSRSRYGFAAFNGLCLLLAWLVLRLIVLFAFRPAVLPPVDVSRALAAGSHRDLLVALAVILPQLLWFLIIPNRWFQARWH